MSGVNKKKRILITGGAGFIGCHLALVLAKDLSNEIVIADNFKRGRHDAEFEALLAMPNVKFLNVDLTDSTAFNRLGSPYEEVYHLAALIGVRNVISHPYETVRVNALSTLYLLEWCGGWTGGKILFASTSEVYAWTQNICQLPVPTPEDVPLALTEPSNARSSYAASKIFGELAVRYSCRKSNKSFVIVRYHNVYGPRMGNEHVIPQIYYRALNGESPISIYSANHSRAFCYISDAVQGTISAMRSFYSGEVFNIGNDEEIEIGDLASLILKKAGIKMRTVSAQADNDPIQRRCPDISKAKKLFGYEPTVTLDEGLDLTLNWYKRRFSEDSGYKIAEAK